MRPSSFFPFARRTMMVAITLAILCLAGRVLANQGFTTPAPLNTDVYTTSSNNSQPSLANDGNGVWVAIWLKNSNVYFARSADNGQTWNAPAKLIINNNPADNNEEEDLAEAA